MCQAAVGVCCIPTVRCECAPGEVTRPFERATQVDSCALDRLLSLIYEELKVVTRSFMRGECPEHTLRTTAFVGELDPRQAQDVELRFLGRLPVAEAKAKARRAFAVASIWLQTAVAPKS